VIAREHFGPARGRVCVVVEQVPAAEHEILHGRQRDQLVDERLAVVGALAEADPTHLRERAMGAAEAAPREHAAGHEGRGHGAHARQQNAELSLRRSDVRGLLHEFSLK
jgi:hypothetical protein